MKEDQFLKFIWTDSLMSESSVMLMMRGSNSLNLLSPAQYHPYDFESTTSSLWILQLSAGLSKAKHSLIRNGGRLTLNTATETTVAELDKMDRYID